MKYVKFALLSLLIALMTNCVYDNDDDCPPPFVHFSYVGDGVKEIFDDKIEKVDFYLFDSNKHLLKTVSIPKADLLKLHGASLDFLPAGDYHIVCVGNAFSNTEIHMDAGANLDSLRIANPHVFDNTEVTTNDSLYIGYKKITIPDKSHYQEVQETIDFTSAHIKIYFEVAGLVAPSATNKNSSKLALDGLHLVIKNLVASVDFRDIAQKQLYTYRPKFFYNSATKLYYTQFNVLRFQEKSAITVNLENETGETVFTMKLEDFLKKYAQFDVTKNEVRLTIHVDFLGEGTAVKVSDWAVNDDYKPHF